LPHPFQGIRRQQRFLPALSNTLYLKKKNVIVVGLLILMKKKDQKIWSVFPSTVFHDS
jgi:hypothetical protein